MSGTIFTILDCQPIYGEYSVDLKNRSTFQAFAQQLGDGLSGNGMIYLVNHEIPQEIMEAVFEQSKQFFQLDDQIKMKYIKTDPVTNFHGYTAPTGSEIVNEIDKSIQDLKESFSFNSREICGTNYPNEVPELRKSILDFHFRMCNFAKKFLLALGCYLKLDDPEFFLEQHKSLDDLVNPGFTPWINIRSNFYMGLDDEIISKLPENALRLTEHSDWGTLTFLVQDQQEGLEAKVNDLWLPVPPIQGSMVLNSGLMLEMWSAGHFPATPHRVRLFKETAKEPRQSVAWFALPDGETRCKMRVNKKEGWTWAHTYPVPNREQSVTEYVEDRIKGIYSSLYKY